MLVKIQFVPTVEWCSEYTRSIQFVEFNSVSNTYIKKFIKQNFFTHKINLYNSISKDVLLNVNNIRKMKHLTIACKILNLEFLF